MVATLRSTTSPATTAAAAGATRMLRATVQRPRTRTASRATRTADQTARAVRTAGARVEGRAAEGATTATPNRSKNYVACNDPIYLPDHTHCLPGRWGGQMCTLVAFLHF